MAQSWQKSYADKRRSPLEFTVGDKVFLKVSPRLAFKGAANKGSWHHDLSHVLDWITLEVEEDGTYPLQPMRILDRRYKVTWSSVIPLVKVLWMYHNTKEATWELEMKMKEKYLHF
ncbi:uncharacterized protein LOC120010519 [Tripterygium wilfordii]|uniref:uncharacterized protein LOC120010519 n=1 Tax=Tripterygium wilfordii TaxID=458696 RepID=UPI0018F7EC52|nr:uncharacterized protein LOC120010519 [Tripterygium wilfordii]